MARCASLASETVSFSILVGLFFIACIITLLVLGSILSYLHHRLSPSSLPHNLALAIPNRPTFMIFVRCDFRYVTSATAPYWPCRTRLAGAFPAYLGVVLTVKSSMTCSGRCQGDNLDTTFRVVVPTSMGRVLPTKSSNVVVSYYDRCSSWCSCGDDVHYRLVRWPLWL